MQNVHLKINDKRPSIKTYKNFMTTYNQQKMI